ncbi:unnamed protein product [Arctogadus glacialis]
MLACFEAFAIHLAEDFTGICNLSLSPSVIPTCCKKTPIVPVLEKSACTRHTDLQSSRAFSHSSKLIYSSLFN